MLAIKLKLFALKKNKFALNDQNNFLQFQNETQVCGFAAMTRHQFGPVWTKWTTVRRIEKPFTFNYE